MTRNGATIPELLAAGVVAAVLMTVTLQYVSAAAAQRKAAQQRRLAAAEVHNILETLSAWAYEDLHDRAGQLKLSETTLAALPQAELSVEVSEAQNDQRAKRILVEINWRGRGGQLQSPVRTVTWRYDIPSQ